MNRTAIAVGLLVALAGPPLVAVLSLRISGPMPSAAASIAGQAALWALAAAVLGIVLLWERLPLRSIGAVPLTGASLLAAVLAAAALLYVATPIGLWLVNTLGLLGFEAGVSRLRSLPAGVLVCAAATAGVVEELLYRGYAIERLTVLTGSRAAAALLSLAAFSLAHLPFWGAGSALLTAVAGIVLTALYLWRRSLAANMVAHALTAAVQLIAITPG